jgi:hypothetical protein
MKLQIIEPKSKKFVYLILARKWYSYFADLQSEHSDAVVLFWNPKQVYTHPSITTLYGGKKANGERSTWNSCRNDLYEYAKQKGYDYYIFLDDDIQPMQMDGLHPFRYFEFMLNLTKPACAAANYHIHFGDSSDYQPESSVQTISLADACFYAFHKDAADFLLPYCEKYDNQSWWISQNIINQISMCYYRGDIVQFNRLKVSNALHQDYPREGYDNYTHIENIIYPQLPLPYCNYYRPFNKALHKNNGPVVCGGDYKREKTIII